MLRAALVGLFLLAAGCSAPTDERAGPPTTLDVPETPTAAAWSVEGDGAGEVSSIDRSRGHAIEVPAAAAGTLVVKLRKTAPTDSVFWDFRDARNETVVFGRAGRGLGQETDEAFDLELPEGGRYTLLIDHDQVGTPGPVGFELAWAIGPA